MRCYVLYDEIGSHDLPGAYVNELRAAGVDIRPFNTRQGRRNRFQLNFRNHRKIVIVRWPHGLRRRTQCRRRISRQDPKIGAWRDTHVKVQGPVVQCVQISWLEDWNWAAGNRPALNWKPAPAPGGEDGLAFCLPSGPADEFETCTLFFLHAIHAAKKRVWIASPYFVPDEQFISALQLAALRGVDVRILVPANADSQLVQLSGFTFLPELEKAGVQTWRYNDGFLHEKAILVDDVLRRRHGEFRQPQLPAELRDHAALRRAIRGARGRGDVRRRLRPQHARDRRGFHRAPMVVPPRRAHLAADGAGAVNCGSQGCFSSPISSVKWNVAPRSGLLVARRRPPWALMTA